jgi:hypothetical protein
MSFLTAMVRGLRAGDRVPRSHYIVVVYRRVARNILGKSRARSFLGLSLNDRAGLPFNAILFSYGLVVKKFFNVQDQKLLKHLVPFAVASFFGPLLPGQIV